MKKTYMTPKLEKIEVRTIGMLDESQSMTKGSTPVSDESVVLGRGDAGWNDDDWD